MTRPTDQELKTELEEIVQKHNQAQAIIKQCEKRFIELTAIIKDRQENSIES